MAIERSKKGEKMNNADFFTRITREAMNEIARGKVSIKDTPTNTLLLACFGMLINHFTHKITRPLWFFAASVFAGIVAYVLISVLTN